MLNLFDQISRFAKCHLFVEKAVFRFGETEVWPDWESDVIEAPPSNEYILWTSPSRSIPSQNSYNQSLASFVSTSANCTFDSTWNILISPICTISFGAAMSSKTNRLTLSLFLSSKGFHILLSRTKPTQNGPVVSPTFLILTSVRQRIPYSTFSSHTNHTS